MLNLSHRPCYFRQEQHAYTGTVVVATHPELEGMRVDGTLTLGGDEGLVVELDNNT